MKNSFGNPSSIHIDGIEAKLIIEKSREKFSLFINSSKSEIYFQSKIEQKLIFIRLSSVNKLLFLNALTYQFIDLNF